MMVATSSLPPQPRRLVDENARSRPVSERRSPLPSLDVGSTTLTDLDLAAAVGAALVLVGGRLRRSFGTGGRAASSRRGLNACRGERALCRGARGEPSRGASMLIGE